MTSRLPALRQGARWNLTSLLTAADPAAATVERHLWLIHLLEWLRHDGAEADPDLQQGATPWPVRRLRHLLNVLDRHPEHQAQVSQLLQTTLGALDATGLLADSGFSPRQGLLSELGERLRLACLPGTPQTRDLGELFLLLFDADAAADAEWIAAIDADTLQRTLRLLVPQAGQRPWLAVMLESIQLLASQIRASGLSAEMRQRMDPTTLIHRPFHQVVQAAEALREKLHEAPRQDQPSQEGSPSHPATLVQEVQYLRAVLAACRAAADSVGQHLDEFGISVNLVFQIDQLHARAERIEILLACLMGAHPAAELQRLLLELVRAGAERRGIRALFMQHYALLARKVTERSADVGEHYITRDAAEYRLMLGHAAGGGAVIGLTTLAKFGLAALALPVFWAGLAAGLNYALSFVIVHLLHWTVATKQPAMTAPSLARRMSGVAASEEALGHFVDEVAHLLRSQMAGILGNLALVVPVVLLCQGASWLLAGRPLIDAASADHVLHANTLLGPTALFAALTGVLLFTASLIAGWVENWFVYHRLDSAIAWNPRIRTLLGSSRAQAWARWWRANISGMAANVSLGLMLGLVPALGTFFGLPVEVRHVTLATGQIAAALGTLGPALLQEPSFWWCVAAIPVTGLLNLGVSFTLAFRVALRSQGLKVKDRGRIYQALRQRWREAPASFMVPPRPAASD